MSVRPAGRLFAVAALVLALAAACGSADEPAPTTTTEFIPSNTQTGGGLADDPSPPPATGKSDPPSVQADGGRTAQPSASPTTTEPVPPSTEADSVPVDDLTSTTTADSTEVSPAPRSVDAGDPDALSADARSLIGSWHTAVSVTTGVWPGFDLALIPTVLAAIDGEGAIRATVAFNHPNPLALGTLIRNRDVDGHKVAVIGEVADPDWLATRSPYDLTADVGGTDTFVLIGQEGELGREPGTPEFITTLVHEAFHRYQWDEWTPSATRQYVDSYDFSEANLESVLLENQILVAAYQADNAGDLERLARQFAAVRATRRQRDYRVAHDEEQERTEGSARFIEHAIGEAIGSVYATPTDHARELELYNQNLAAPELQRYSIKSFISFFRFYSSGATLLVLLERLGASEVARQLEDGRTPAGLLERHVAPLGDLDELVAAARADHDPDRRLASAAATLSARAIDEPPTGLGHDDGEFVLTDAQLGCLRAFGIEFSDTPVFRGRISIPPAPAHACIVPGDDGGFVLMGAQIACLDASGIEVSNTPTIGDRVGIPQDVFDECMVEADDSSGASP